MAQPATRVEYSSSDDHEEDSTETETEQNEEQTRIPPNKRDSITHYVTNVLHHYGKDEEQPQDFSQTEIRIETKPNARRDYENLSAFRQYQSNQERPTRIDSQRRRTNDENTTISDEDESRDQSTTEPSGDIDESLGELNLDPNPIIEERESGDQVYKQKVFLRQLQPPTPQPIDIQVQEVLIPSQAQKPPIHVRVGQREPRTPSPIVIKSAPPQPPPQEADQPIIYNKYLPPPKQPPQQIVIHRYPDLPPKPRPIVVEQWLPYKPAPKRIIKHSLPRELLQTPPPPHNLLVSYAKPRALVEVELVRLPIVKIDPQTYQQMTADHPQQLAQHPPFRHEQDYLPSNRDSTNPLHWRI